MTRTLQEPLKKRKSNKTKTKPTNFAVNGPTHMPSSRWGTHPQSKMYQLNVSVRSPRPIAPLFPRPMAAARRFCVIPSARAGPLGPKCVGDLEAGSCPAVRPFTSVAVRRSAYAFFGPPVKSHLFLNYVNPLGELVTELIPNYPLV